MSRKRSSILTDHELRLMEVLWQTGRASVADVTERIGTPPLAYNTVLTTLRTLEQKGYVTHEEDGRAFIFRPLVAQQQAADSAMRHLLRRFFGNSPGQLALRLIDDKKLDDEDLTRIQKALSKKRKASR